MGCDITGETQEEEALGWGVHIVEGPNKVALSLAVFAGIGLSFIVSVLYAIIAKTQEQGFGIGSCMMASSAAIIAALYY